jgi:hypothetical protein
MILAESVTIRVATAAIKPNQYQELEDLTDDIKQSFIRDYKTCYSE